MVLHWRRCGRVGGCRIPLKKNREKFYYNKTGIDIQNPVTPERSYEIPFELKRSVPTHISREVLLHITGFTSDQRIEQKFSFLMTDKASVKSSAEADMYLENCIYEIIQENVKRLEIGKRDIRGVIF